MGQIKKGASFSGVIDFPYEEGSKNGFSILHRGGGWSGLPFTLSVVLALQYVFSC